MTTETDKAEKLRRRRARERLMRAEGKLGDFEYRLKALHADRSGSFRMLYRPPLVPDEFYVLNRGIQRNEREARAGCPEALEWLERTAELRSRIDTLRATPLPEKDPNYSGPSVVPCAAIRAGKRPRRPCLPPPSAMTVVHLSAEQMVKVVARERRGRRLLDEFIAESARDAMTSE